MFLGCNSLVGGNGTVFDEEHFDDGYAHVDATGNPGYSKLPSLSRCQLHSSSANALAITNANQLIEDNEIALLHADICLGSPES